MSKPPVGRRVLSAWEKLHNKPGGKFLFSRLIRWMVPYTGSIGARVEELRPGYAKATLKDHRKVQNHLQSIHAIALANLGELTTGLATMAGMPPKTRSILRGLEVTYDKKARGTLTSTCTCDVVAPDENTEYAIQSEVRDEAGDIVSTVTALWIIGPERKE